MTIFKKPIPTPGTPNDYIPNPPKHLSPATLLNPRLAISIFIVAALTLSFAILPASAAFAASPFSKVTGDLETLKDTAISIAQVLGGLLAVIGVIITIKGYGNHQNGQEMSTGAKLALSGIALAGVPTIVSWFM